MAAPPTSGTFRVSETEEEAGIDLRRYLDLVLRYWKLIVAVVAVSAAVSLVKTYRPPRSTGRRP